MPRKPPQTATVRTLPALLALLALLAVATLAGCTDDGAPEVGLARVQRATVTEVVEAPASVAARATATVSSPAAGTVASVDVTDGQRVTRGQVLLRLDSPTARRALDQARDADARAASTGASAVPHVDLAALRRPDPAADRAFAAAEEAARAVPDEALRARALAGIERARADHRAARTALARAVDQLSSGLDGLGALASSLAGAQRAQTRAAVTAARATVDALTVRAPIAGTVVLGGSGGGAGGGAGGGSGGGSGGAPDLSSVLQQLPAGVQAQAQSLLPPGAAGAGVSALPAAGVPVAAGSPLLTVTDVSALGLTASVDETDVLLVRPGNPAEVELDAAPGAVYPATVRSVDLLPTTSTRGGVAYAVRLSLGAGRTDGGGAAPTPRPGMSAVARLTVRTARDAPSVPASAVFRDGTRDVVWLVEGGRAHRREVRLGAQGDDRVEVTAGLAATDTVVVRGADRVTENQQVGGP